MLRPGWRCQSQFRRAGISISRRRGSHRTVAGCSIRHSNRTGGRQRKTHIGTPPLSYIKIVRSSVRPFRVGVLCSWTTPGPNRKPPILFEGPLPVTCLSEVRNSSTPWSGGEGAASLRTLICRRALGLLLLDWSSVVLKPLPWFYPGPMRDLKCSTRELLVVARAGQIDRTKCTK